jgi:hypothetical protein
LSGREVINFFCFAAGERERESEESLLERDEKKI